MAHDGAFVGVALDLPRPFPKEAHALEKMLCKVLQKLEADSARFRWSTRKLKNVPGVSVLLLLKEEMYARLDKVRDDGRVSFLMYAIRCFVFKFKFVYDYLSRGKDLATWPIFCHLHLRGGRCVDIRLWP